jgi:hypothetical protein
MGRIEYAGMQPHTPYVVVAVVPDHGRSMLAVVGSMWDSDRAEGEVVVLLPDGRTAAVSRLAEFGIEVLGVSPATDPAMLTAEHLKRLADTVTGTTPIGPQLVVAR